MKPWYLQYPTEYIVANNRLEGDIRHKNGTLFKDIPQSDPATTTDDHDAPDVPTPRRSTREKKATTRASSSIKKPTRNVSKPQPSIGAKPGVKPRATTRPTSRATSRATSRSTSHVTSRAATPTSIATTSATPRTRGSTQAESVTSNAAPPPESVMDDESDIDPMGWSTAPPVQVNPSSHVANVNDNVDNELPSLTSTYHPRTHAVIGKARHVDGFGDRAY